MVTYLIVGYTITHTYICIYMLVIENRIKAFVRETDKVYFVSYYVIPLRMSTGEMILLFVILHYILINEKYS